MSELKVGDKIKDNDPRMGNRVLVIDRLWWPTDGDNEKARAVAHSIHGRRQFSILLRRIYADGKARRSGFSLVTA